MYAILVRFSLSLRIFPFPPGTAHAVDQGLIWVTFLVVLLLLDPLSVQLPGFPFPSLLPPCKPLLLVVSNELVVVEVLRDEAREVLALCPVLLPELVEAGHEGIVFGLEDG
jgi:hypothetical protein